MDEKKKRVIKTVIIVVLIGVAIFLCVRYAVPFCQLLGTENGMEMICQRVEGYGIFAPLVFILLMVLQIIVAFIPGGPLEIIAGMLFGGVKGLLYTMAGVLLGTLLVYTIVRKFGRPIVDFFVSEKDMKHFKFLEEEEKLEFWVFLLFLIPGIPKDLLTYVVPLTALEGKKFLLISLLARSPSLIASVLVGDSLSDGNIHICVAICAVTAVAIFIGFQVKNHITKNHMTKEQEKTS